MDIRPATPADLNLLSEIDGTIESSQYLHVGTTGEGVARGWTIEPRPRRERFVRSNPLGDDEAFRARQIVTGGDDGFALMVEHDDLPVALLIAQDDAARGVMQVHTLRVDFDHRREGLATALLYQAITEARRRELRAVAAETTTENFPAAALLSKLGFDLAGIDTRRLTNHDLVKEAVTLFWYASLD